LFYTVTAQVLRPKVRLFLRSKFFDGKRSAADDRKIKDFSLENIAKVLCLATGKRPMKGFPACLVVHLLTITRHLAV
jgi:hypothetical protein